MKTYLRNPFFVAAVLIVFMAGIFFLIPLNIFDGEVTYDNGVQVFTRKQPISLSYFIGIVSEGDSLDGVQLRLTPKGWILAILMIVGFPSLIGYRIWIANQHRESKAKS